MFLLQEVVGPETVLGEQMELEDLLAQKITTLENDLTTLRQQLLDSRESESELRVQLNNEKTAYEATSLKLSQYETSILMLFCFL